MSTIAITGIPSYVVEYTGNPITFPALGVEYNNAALVKDTDYTVAYSNNTDPGVGAICIKGKGSYNFRKDISFSIVNYNEDPDYTVTELGPYPDIGIGQKDIINEHNVKINDKTYNQAVSLLDTNNIGGFRAAVFNAIQEKLKYTQEYLLTKKIPSYYEYSNYEPISGEAPFFRQEFEPDTYVYGVEVDMTTGTFTRLENAVGKTAGADFDKARPFHRRRCNLADDGTVNAYYGDANYKEDGSNGQVMVEQPSFYYKMEPLVLDGDKVRKARYYVTGAPKNGFKIFPAFVQFEEQKDVIYLSAYEGCLYDTSSGDYLRNDEQVGDFLEDKLSSIANVKPMSGLTQNATRPNVRMSAHKRGMRWELSYAATVSASQWLLLIEYASFNVQDTIGMGNVSKTDDSLSNMAEITGGTSRLGNASGAVTNNNGVQVVSYRGEENLWGDIWTWVDGMNIQNPSSFAEGDIGTLNVADHNFSDNAGSSSYKDTGIHPCYGSGYVSAFGYSKEFDWLFIPVEHTGNSSIPVGDYFWNGNPGWRVATLGGHWGDGAGAGVFYLDLHDASSERYRGIGGRLVYIPLTP